MTRRLWLHSSAETLPGVRVVVNRLAPGAQRLSSVTQADGPVQGDLVLVNFDALPADERQELTRLPGRGLKAVLFSGGECRQSYAHLFESGVLTNLVALDRGRVDPAEFQVTLRKLLGGPLFGLEQYIGVTPVEAIRVTRSADRPFVLDRARQLALSAGVQPRLVDGFRNVIDELVTNALYNAPVDASGQPCYAHLSRREEVKLAPGGVIEVRLVCQRERLTVSVADPFGSFRPERLLSSLSRCYRKDAGQIEQKAGGAGIGIYQVLETVSEFVLNIHPGERTEVIGFMDLRPPQRRLSGKCKSFNLFVEGNP